MHYSLFIFDLLWKTLVELNLIHRPDRVWNLDETSFCHDPSKTKIVGGIGISTTRTTHGSVEITLQC